MKFLFAFGLLLLSWGFTQENPSWLVGTWKITTANVTSTFAEDGTFTFSRNGSPENGIWFVIGDELTMQWQSPSPITGVWVYALKKISDSSFQISGSDIEEGSVLVFEKQTTPSLGSLPGTNPNTPETPSLGSLPGTQSANTEAKSSQSTTQPSNVEVPPDGPLLQRHLCFYYTTYWYPCSYTDCMGLQPNPAWFLTFQDGGTYNFSSAVDNTDFGNGTYTWDTDTLEIIFLSGPMKDEFYAQIGTDSDMILLSSADNEDTQYECYPDGE